VGLIITYLVLRMSSYRSLYLCILDIRGHGQEAHLSTMLLVQAICAGSELGDDHMITLSTHFT
jgi:hypothetical protein